MHPKPITIAATDKLDCEINLVVNQTSSSPALELAV